jgi:SAM-dependent methyltransferase
LAEAPAQTFVVVYQFGKVASTALVAALNDQPGVEAVQSHFLGESALQKTLGSCLNPQVNDYFYFHQSGQLATNLAITRRINRILAGYEPETRLVLLSTVREPLDWLRSAITQDVRGFLELFLDAKVRHGLAGETLEDLAEPSLSALLGEIAQVVESFGSIDALLENRPTSLARMRGVLTNAALQEMFYSAIRPFDWHRILMEPVFGCRIDEFQPNGKLFTLRRPRFDAHLFRYEDMKAILPNLSSELGLPKTLRVKARNVSKGKLLEEKVRRAFGSAEARRLAALFADTDYARRFGYLQHPETPFEKDGDEAAAAVTGQGEVTSDDITSPEKTLPEDIGQAPPTAHRLTGDIPILCPACHEANLKGNEQRVVCPSCGTEWPVVDGLIDLRPDATADTLLDDATYDETHAVTPETSAPLFRFYAAALGEFGQGAKGRVLEIGAGTGNLTVGLAAHGQFSEIHCADLSPRFMARLLDKVTLLAPKTPFYPYLLDANSLPFAAASFDAVLGHSVLHHLLHFEETLADTYRILRPGGVAMFGDPMMEGHALLHLAAGQISALEAAGIGPPLLPRTRAILDRLAGLGALKRRNLKTRDDEVARSEDKFIFPTAVLRRLALNIGFKSVDFRYQGEAPDLAQMLWERLTRTITIVGGSVEDIAPYRSLFRPFSTSYGAGMGDAALPFFAFAVLVK